MLQQHSSDRRLLIALQEMGLVMGVYIASFAVVEYLFKPAQDMALELTLVGSLLYLPHGVRVLATWLFHGKSILPLALAEIFCTLYLWSPDFELDYLILASLIGGASCFVAYELFRLAGIDLDFSPFTRPNWKALILVAALGSVISSYGHAFAYAASFDPQLILVETLTFLVGDVLGTLALIFLALTAHIGLRKFGL